MMQEPEDAPGPAGHAKDWEDATDSAHGVERQLAQYAFVREERDREVRLTFREVPALHIARAFREAGAALISITGERLATTAPAPDAEQTGKAPAASAGDAHPRHSRKAGTGHHGGQGSAPQGEVLLRYF